MGEPIRQTRDNHSCNQHKGPGLYSQKKQLIVEETVSPMEKALQKIMPIKLGCII